MTDDLALVAARFGAALRGAGVPAGPARCARFAAAVTVARPATRYQLYLCALATMVSGQAQLEPLRRVFADFFGGTGEEQVPPGAADMPRPVRGTPDDLLAEAARVAQQHGLSDRDGQHDGAAPDGPAAGGPGGTGRAPVAGGQAAQDEDQDGTGIPALASRAERLAGTDFAELTPGELQALAGLMRQLTLAVPLRRSRRYRPTSRGRHTDVRSTLRQARRTGGHPLRLARRAPAMRPRQLIVLCDISGSMEPYARAMLQLLYCAAGGAGAEVFTFATRLTRLTPALAHLPAGQALRQAGQAAPDWLGGTRIGAALQEFNDTRGRPGLARGAVVLIISDGWDTGDPAVVRREMQRLSRVAHRIIWVNPRTKNEHYRPLAGGMAAAWPFCDAVVSAHSVHALDELTEALAHPSRHRPSSLDGTRRLPASE
ncbi:MAG TPA: VWA domain-containing protein [Streptosporangiaceae bacterium]|nr:VWA domain-containing protein [Streptosporangiaceae bacterium]